MEEINLIRQRMLKGLIKPISAFVDMSEESVVERKEGEEWEEDGKKWIMSNGVPKKINIITKNIINDLFCPKCKKYLKTDVDVKLIKVSNMCSKCVAEFETTLKKEGKFEEFQKNEINKNIDYDIKCLQEELEAFLTMPLRKKHINDAGQELDIEFMDDRQVAIQKVEKKIEQLMKMKII